MPEGLRGLEWLIVPILTIVGAALGIVGKGFYDTRFKKIDDAAKIREELWKEVGRLREFNDKIGAKYQSSRTLIADLDIASSRFIARLEETADVISTLLAAEECLNHHDVARANAILRLIERDKGMFDEMKIEERVKASEIG